MSCSFKSIFLLLISITLFTYCSDSNDKMAKIDDVSSVKLSITPMQCKEPWAQTKGNNLEARVTNYLKAMNITLISFKDGTPKGISVCEACEICPGPTVIITVDKSHTASLLEKGFIVVTD